MNIALADVATRSRRSQRWFPTEPLRSLIELRRRDGFGLNAIALDAGISRRRLQRAVAREVLRSDAADELAIALGRHPSELWPEWFGTIHES